MNPPSVYNYNAAFMIFQGFACYGPFNLTLQCPKNTIGGFGAEGMARNRPLNRVEEQAVLANDLGELLQPETIVWAKLRGYPWWPGLVAENGPDIPIIVCR